MKELQYITEEDCIGLPISKICDDNVRWPYRIEAEVRAQWGGTQEFGPDEVEPNFDLGRILGLYLAEGCIKWQSKSKKWSCPMR